MMKLLKITFHFLGSVYLALLLIFTTAVMVITGTILESSTDSHLWAARWTYDHPFFGVLLCFFFINILFAALRRWPFKFKHIPFLITHFGLLMIIGGTLLKSKVGLQGHMNILEGSGTRQVILPNTFALQIEGKDLNHIHLPIDMQRTQNIYSSKKIPGISFKAVSFYPHVQEKYETWIKGDFVCLSGHPPIHINLGVDSELYNYLQVQLDESAEKWNASGIRTKSPSEAIQKRYLDNLNLQVSSKVNPGNMLNISLKENLQSPINFDDGVLTISICLDYNAIRTFENPHFLIKWQSNHSKECETIKVPLQGNQALYNLVQSGSWTGVSRFDIDLKRDAPVLLIIEDQLEDIHVCAFDLHGRVHSKIFHQTEPNSLIVYDDGFGGYTVQNELPYPNCPSSRKDKEIANARNLANEINQAINRANNLSPPLALLKKACENTQINFPETLVEFLTLWRQSCQPLFPKIDLTFALKKVLEKINWQDIDELDYQACLWTCLFFERLEKPMKNNEDIFSFLEKNKWPFVNELRKLNRDEVLTGFSQQIYSISGELPKPGNSKCSVMDKAGLLSAYFKMHGIDYRILDPIHKEGEEDFEKLTSQQENGEKKFLVNKFIETPLSIRYLPIDSPGKIEDRHPCILIEVTDGTNNERLALAYHSAGLGLKRPILNSQYKIGFQSGSIEIPYRIRLKQAREVQYPHTQQAYSYESDILISNSEGEALSKTLSMNHVYETWDGYRFYLAGMHTLPSGIKKVQITVNHDPCKYLLTYPGALLVSLGALIIVLAQVPRPNKN